MGVRSIIDPIRIAAGLHSLALELEPKAQYAVKWNLNPSDMTGWYVTIAVVECANNGDCPTVMAAAAPSANWSVNGPCRAEERKRRQLVVLVVYPSTVLE